MEKSIRLDALGNGWSGECGSGELNFLLPEPATAIVDAYPELRDLTCIC
jgi:hypothetical protein